MIVYCIRVPKKRNTVGHLLRSPMSSRPLNLSADIFFFFKKGSDTLLHRPSARDIACGIQAPQPRIVRDETAAMATFGAKKFRRAKCWSAMATKQRKARAAASYVLCVCAPNSVVMNLRLRRSVDQNQHPHPTMGATP